MKRFFFIIIILLFLIYLYGSFIEVNAFKIKEYTLASDNIPTSFKDLKIVHFSDLLYIKGNDKILDKLTNEINKVKPDIIIFSGDLLKKNENYTDDDYQKLSEFLKSLDASLYKYAVIGDNDEKYLDKYKDILYDGEFILLDNESTLFFYKDMTPINIVGITNDKAQLDSLFTKDVSYNYSLVITHEPDNASLLTNYNVNTIMAGHSLGGLINIPYYGGIVKKNGALKYVNNSYQINNTNLYISNGIGYENFNFRIFNTPSINIYHFER